MRGERAGAPHIDCKPGGPATAGAYIRLTGAVCAALLTANPEE